LVGMVFLEFLGGLRVIPDLTAAASVTFVVNNLRTVRFGAGEDHSRAAAIALSRFIQRRAVSPAGHGIAVDIERVRSTIGELAEEVQRIAVSGDHDGAGRLIEGSAFIPSAIQDILPKLTEIPTDLEFIFEPSES
jgi:hypothetical protein